MFALPAGLVALATLTGAGVLDRTSPALARWLFVRHVSRMTEYQIGDFGFTLVVPLVLADRQPSKVFEHFSSTRSGLEARTVAGLSIPVQAAPFMSPFPMSVMIDNRPRVTQGLHKLHPFIPAE